MTKKEPEMEAKDGDKTEEESGKILWMDKEMIPCKLLFFVMDIGWSCGFAFIRYAKII